VERNNYFEVWSENVYYFEMYKYCLGTLAGKRENYLLGRQQDKPEKHSNLACLQQQQQQRLNPQLRCS